MPAVQTSYSDTMRVAFPGMVANSEDWNAISRTADGDIEFGMPVRRSGDHNVLKVDEIALEAVGAAGEPAPAGATITAAPTAVAPAKVGDYRVEAIVGGAGTASKWRVTDPDGELVGVASGNTQFVGGGLTFTVTDAGTDPTVGEAFAITVAEAAAEGADAASLFLGVAVRDITLPPTNSPVDTYAQYDTVTVLTHGVVWVTAGDTVAAGEPVYFDEADSRYTNEVTDYPLPGWVFDSSAVDGGLVKIARR